MKRIPVLWPLCLVVFGGDAYGQNATAPFSDDVSAVHVVRSSIHSPDSSVSRAIVPAAGVLVRERAPLAAFGIESLGGIAGSAAGFGAVALLAGDCAAELTCALGTATTAVLMGTAVSAGGAYLFGRLAGTEPNGPGAIIGALAGAAAVIGVDHVLSNVNTSDSGRRVAYALSQGLLTAAGSRIGALLR
ncbi:MAG TPA: hypothetical protein VFZ24_12525 [Longimicrobiales bacterium]